MKNKSEIKRGLRWIGGNLLLLQKIKKNMETVPPIRKPSSVLSWIGFGISAGVFLLIWFVYIALMAAGGGQAPLLTSVVMLLLLVGGFLGLIGLVFSIVGLIQAINNQTKKWMSVWGIVFFCLSVVSVFVGGFLVAAVTSSSKEKIKATESVSDWDSPYYDEPDFDEPSSDEPDFDEPGFNFDD